MFELGRVHGSEASTHARRWRSLGKSLRQKRLREVPARNKEKGMAPRNAGKADPGNHKAPSTDKPVAQGILSDLGRRHDFGADAITGKNQKVPLRARQRNGQGRSTASCRKPDGRFSDSAQAKSGIKPAAPDVITAAATMLVPARRKRNTGKNNKSAP